MNIFEEFLSLFFPQYCIVCLENLQHHERQICLSCLHNIPRTNYHLQPNNPVEKRFWGKVPIARATSFFFFKKGSPFQKLLHSLKYKGNKEIGEILGQYAGAELLSSEEYRSVDVIIPVPLHPSKFKKRGYNQSECIAKGIADVLFKPLDNNTLVRLIENPTQTKKSVYERYENTTGIFDLSSTENIKDKHILLVDDVLTTGSTLEACIRALLKTENIKISVFTLAVA